MTTKQRSRHQNALSRLEAQLTAGTKPEKLEGKTTSNTVSLTETDTKRIKREIETLTKSLS